MELMSVCYRIFCAHFRIFAKKEIKTMTISETQQEIISEFSMFEDWMDKYNYLIEMGKDMPQIDERYKTNNHLISGCQSRVWLHADLQEGMVFFLLLRAMR